MFPLLIYFEVSKNFAIIEKPENLPINVPYRTLKVSAIPSDLKMVTEIYALGQKNPVQYSSGGRD